MLPRIQSLGSCLMVVTLLLFAGSAAAQDVSPRCEAAMDRAAGHYSKCLLSADASYARHENATKLENRQTRCETRFDRRTSRAITRHGADECTSAELVAALADRTVTCAEGVATEAGGEAAASLLYVQNADGGTLTETTLTLTGVSLQTGWFTDRPYRDAGRMTTAAFVALFSEERANSFAENPPDADFTCESGGEVVNQVVTLTDPVLDEAAGTLTYTAALVASAGEGDSFSEITCDGDAHLFIDDDLMTAHNFICDGQAYHACKVAGGTWDMGTKTCTPGVTQAGCEAGGGTWDAASSTCTSSYNCFIGGFCSYAAKLLPPAQTGYINVYEDHAQATKPASGAGCNDLLGAIQWSEGAEYLNSVADTKYWKGLCTGGLKVVMTEAILIGKHEGSCDAACQ